MSINPGDISSLRAEMEAWERRSEGTGIYISDFTRRQVVRVTLDVLIERERLQARIAELETVLHRLATCTPPTDLWVQGHWVCLACHRDAPSVKAIKHEPDCAWVAAQNQVKMREP